MTYADPRLLLAYRQLRGVLAPRQTLNARFSAFLERVVEADRRSRDLQTLCDLPDHLLRDIGLHRDDLARLAGRSRLPWP
jgi:uncharacterized protein YjiS (DUF1127 family)